MSYTVHHTAMTHPISQAPSSVRPSQTAAIAALAMPILRQCVLHCCAASAQQKSALHAAVYNSCHGSMALVVLDAPKTASASVESHTQSAFLLSVRSTAVQDARPQKIVMITESVT